MSKSEVTKKFSEMLEEVVQLDHGYSVNLHYSEIVRSAEWIGIPYSTLRNYLDNKNECSITNLYRIASYFEVSADYLLGLSENIGGKYYYDEIEQEIDENMVARRFNIDIESLKRINEIDYDKKQDRDKVINSDCFLELINSYYEMRIISQKNRDKNIDEKKKKQIDKKIEILRLKAQESLTRLLDSVDYRINEE